MRSVIYILVIMTFFIISCESDSDEKNEIPADYMETTALFNCNNCFLITNINGYSGFVIKDDETYQKYADSMRIHPLNINCDTATLIDIDFEKFILIGIKEIHGSCDQISRNLILDKKNEKILYSIIINESNEDCDMVAHISLNLALISKIPDNYKVEFSVNRH